MTWLLVALGGAAGAVLRFAVGRLFTARPPGTFPWATFGINVAGSLILGAVMALTHDTDAGWRARALLGIGFCGGFTTFSSFSYETLGLLEARAYTGATVYALGSVAAGLAAVATGLWLAERV
jgi:fluoride exporter